MRTLIITVFKIPLQKIVLKEIKRVTLQWRNLAGASQVIEVNT